MHSSTATDSPNFDKKTKSPADCDSALQVIFYAKKEAAPLITGQLPIDIKLCFDYS